MNKNRTVRLLAIPIIAMMMLCGAFLIQDASDDSDADDSDNLDLRHRIPSITT